MRKDTEHVIERSGLPIDVIGSSERWGVEKPDRAFFERAAACVGFAPREVAYVGDRLDDDVAPAAATGTFAVRIKRGLWAEVQAMLAEPVSAQAVVEFLDELPTVLP